ncbi:MAG TPA: hypothetical protein VH088_15570 [Terriglobales bacterium]|nr:hypothetical protein [Terriglobales bacterium]
MSTHRAHILLPEDLLREIDALVGPRGRSSFLVETARAEVRRQKLLKFLESKEVIWADKDHPELTDGADVWVNNMRQESDAARGYSSKSPARRVRSRKRARVG